MFVNGSKGTRRRNLSFVSIFLWSIRGQNRTVPLPPGATLAAVVRFTIGAFFYIVAIALAFLNAPASLTLNAAIALYYVFEQTPTQAASQSEPA